MADLAVNQIFETKLGGVVIMNEEKTCKVNFADDDHCWINNQQFVSLRRLNQLRAECYHEIEFLNNRIKALADENEAHKVLLRKEITE